MPDEKSTPSPFEVATAALEEWLDGAGAAFASRTTQPDARRKVASWTIELQHAQLGVQKVIFAIPRDFPATTPQLFFDKELCLVLPHIEEDGRFCHGVEPSPQDYDWPAGAANAVLQKLDQFWKDSHDPAWVISQFHEERLSYWIRFCERFRVTNKVPSPRDVRVVLPDSTNQSEGKVVAYFRQGLKLRSEVMVATPEKLDPHVLASRHGWTIGSLVRGNALFVPIPSNIRWTPHDWPRTLSQLDSFVAQATDHELSVVHWIQDKADEGRQIFLVVLVQENVCYAYQISPAPVLGVTAPGVIPLAVTRVDADWALARDHQVEVLKARRQKRILILGCGSLGAPVAELLARSGVGEIHLLDKETFSSENTARHLLGASDIGQTKVDAMAKRLRALIPGLSIKAHHALAADWVRHVCRPGVYDLVVDCTGESSVRVALSHNRAQSLGDCPLVHAWVEPFCAATHVAFLASGVQWTAEELAPKIAAAHWDDDSRVRLPACSAGFHPYGAADIWQAAGFTSERLISLLDGQLPESTVWSWVRSKAYFDNLPGKPALNPIVPSGKSSLDAAQITRPLREISAQ